MNIAIRKPEVDNLRSVLLYHLDVPTLQLASLSNKYPEILNDEDFWKQRLQVNTGVDGLILGKTYKETWHILHAVTTYVFNFEYISCTMEDGVVRETSILEEEEVDKFFCYSFFHRIGKSLQDIAMKIATSLCKHYVRYSDKQISVTLCGTYRWSEFDIATRFQYGIERVLCKEKNENPQNTDDEELDVEPIIEGVYYERKLRVKGYSTLTY